MPDLGTEIFKKYGASAIVAAIVFASLVWGLAHFAASPGTEVSVLWGLVKYTKSQVTLDSYDASESAQPAGLTTAKPLRPITIETIPNVSSGDVAHAIDSVRQRFRLRELSTLESGRPVSAMPAGTYFFVSVYYFDGPFWKEGLRPRAFSAPANRFNSLRPLYCEAHLLTDSNLYVVGFTGEQSAADISHLSGDHPRSIVLAPYILPSMNSLVLIPLERIVAAKTREIELSKGGEEYPVLDLTVR